MKKKLLVIICRNHTLEHSFIQWYSRQKWIFAQQRITFIYLTRKTDRILHVFVFMFCMHTSRMHNKINIYLNTLNSVCVNLLVLFHTNFKNRCSICFHVVILWSHHNSTHCVFIVVEPFSIEILCNVIDLFLSNNNTLLTTIFVYTLNMKLTLWIFFVYFF